jgi:sugar lactone lactonase YvrE
VIIAAEETDDRTIRRYIFGKDFKRDAIRCPDDTGSFLAYDGDEFFVSQRFDQRIVVIDEAGTALRAFPTPGQVTGMTIAGGRISLVITADTKSKEYKLVRVDARGAEPEVVELAAFPFVARSLGFDGTRFWTHDRDARQIVAFARPD